MNATPTGRKSDDGRYMTVPTTAADVLATKHRWYHTIDLDDGRATPGWIDLRKDIACVGLPNDMSGLRALDCGMFDGFWAFEMERRGAAVIGIDIDDIPPPDIPAIHYAKAKAEADADALVTSNGFYALKEHFQSSVERNVGSLLELSAERIGGPADFAFVGSLLLHLRDPVGGLEAVHRALKPGARIVLFEPASMKLKRGGPAAEFRALKGIWTWWYPNVECLEHWLRTAGFDQVTRHGEAIVKDITGNKQKLVAVHGVRPA